LRFNFLTALACPWEMVRPNIPIKIPRIITP
jgi:hypothetical protein